MRLHHQLLTAVAVSALLGLFTSCLSIRGGALFEGLTSPVAGQRIAAARAAADRDKIDPTFIPVLVGALGDDYFEVRMGAAEALAKMGPSALPALKDALASDDYYRQTYAAIAIGKMGEAAADRDLAARLIAVTQLPGCDQQRQEWAALALLSMKCRDPAIAPALKAAYRSTSIERTRYCLAMCLTYLGDDGGDIIPELVAQIGERDHAKQALLAFGKPAVEPLLEAVKDETDKRKAWSIYETLVGLGADASAVVPLLVQELQNPRDPWFGAMAAEWLGDVGVFDESVVSALEAASRSDEQRIADAATKALARRR